MLEGEGAGVVPAEELRSQLNRDGSGCDGDEAAANRPCCLLRSALSDLLTSDDPSP